MILATKTLAQINKIIEQRQGDGFRRHLGASIIGHPCGRKVWYIWRWAGKTRVLARILRLWDRGNREEERFVKWLRDAGVHVIDRNPENPREQIRVEDHQGHFGGSLDATIYDAPDFPQEWVLGEFKTHNKDSFNDLKKNGVRKSKHEHFVQMQIYMHYRGLRAALYFAINKNDDDMHIEIVEYERDVALQFIERAGRIIDTPVPPARINESPGWYLCQMCDFSRICHDGKAKAQNCRTCVNSRPIEQAQWICTRYNYVLSEAEQRLGCADYQAIPED